MSDCCCLLSCHLYMVDSYLFPESNPEWIFLISNSCLIIAALFINDGFEGMLLSDEKFKSRLGEGISLLHYSRYIYIF